MKLVIVFILFMLASLITYGQEIKRVPLPEYVIAAPELMVPIQGNGSGYLNDYLIANLQYPANSILWNEEGVEVVKFVVTPNGEVTDLAVINSISREIDREVFRVLNTTSGKWRPILENDKPVAREKEVSITFSTEGANTYERFLRIAKNSFVAGNKKFYVKENYRSALYMYDRVVCYMPHDKSALLTRGMCKYQLGDKKGACIDWNRVKTLGGMESDSFLNAFCGMDGYAEMVEQVAIK